MDIKHQDFILENDEDVDKYVGEISQFDNVHLNLRNTKVNTSKFKSLFDNLCRSQKTIFEIDLSNTEMNEEKVDSILTCLRNWENLKQLHLNFSNLNFTDQQFKNICDSIEKSKKLELLTFNLENVVMDKEKRDYLFSLFEDLPNLKNISINTKNTEMNKEDVYRINKIIHRYPSFVHFHDFPSIASPHFCSYHHFIPKLL